jgi:hypothetical protein
MICASLLPTGQNFGYLYCAVFAAADSAAHFRIKKQTGHDNIRHFLIFGHCRPLSLAYPLADCLAGKDSRRHNVNPSKSAHCLILFFLIIGMMLAPSLRAADNSDWANLKQLAPGQRVSLALFDGKSIHGDFLSVSETDITVRSAGGEQNFPRQSVRRVSLQRNGHRGKHALIGAAIGAGAGLGAGAAIDAQCSPNDIFCTGNKGKAILTPVFALVGAGIGALLPSHGWREIYRAR